MCTQYNAVALAYRNFINCCTSNECCVNLINLVIALNISLIIVVLTMFEVILRQVILLQVKYMLWILI